MSLSLVVSSDHLFFLTDDEAVQKVEKSHNRYFEVKRNEAFK